MKRVAVTRRIFPELIEELARRYTLVDNQADHGLGAAELAARLRDCDAALITAGEKVDDALLAPARGCRW